MKSLDIPDMSLRETGINLHFQYVDNRGRISRCVETQLWLWDDTDDGPGLVRWLRSGQGIFWISGKPGSGKSTAMKNLWRSEKTVSFLPSDARDLQPSWLKICAFFHDRGSSIQKSLTGVMSKLIHQILEVYPSLIKLVAPCGLGVWGETKPGMGDNNAHAFSKYNSSFLWDFEKLQSAFLEIVRQTTTPLNILALVDALDEHQEGSSSVGHLQMVQFFEKLVNSTSPAVKIKLIVSSRPEV